MNARIIDSTYGTPIVYEFNNDFAYDFSYGQGSAGRISIDKNWNPQFNMAETMDKLSRATVITIELYMDEHLVKKIEGVSFLNYRIFDMKSTYGLLENRVVERAEFNFNTTL